MIDGEPQIGLRSFNKLPDKTLLRQINPIRPQSELIKQIASKRETKIDLSLIENKPYVEMVKDVKQDLIRIYGLNGIKITEDMFPELIISRNKDKINGSSNTYLGTENVAVVTIDEVPSLFDVIHIYHELGHGISSRTVILDQEKGENIYFHTGLRTLNMLSKVNTGQILEEGLMRHMSIQYAANSKDQTASELRKKFFEDLEKREIVSPGEYPDTDEGRYQAVKENTKSRMDYSYALTTILDLLQAERALNKEQNGKLLSELLWARVQSTRKKGLIRYIDSITANGIGSRVITTPLEAEKIKDLNVDIRDAYLTRVGK